MDTKILFKDFKELPHLRKFVSDCADSIIGKFDSQGRLMTNIIIGTLGGNRNIHKPVFECEVLVHGPELGRTFVAKKRHKDFEKSVRGALRVAEKILRRNSAKRHALRRRVVCLQPIAV